MGHPPAGGASWHLSLGRLGSDVGVRLDHQPWAGRDDVSPRAALSLALSRRLSASAGFGVYRQRLSLLLITQDPANRSLEDMRAYLARAPAQETDWGRLPILGLEYRF